MTGWVRCLIRRWSHHILAYWDFPPHQVGIQIESSSRSSVLFFPSSKSLIRFCRNLERTFPSLGGWSLEPKPPKQPQVWCWPATTNARVESLISSCLQAKVEVEDQTCPLSFSDLTGKSQKSWCSPTYIWWSWPGPGTGGLSSLSIMTKKKILFEYLQRKNHMGGGRLKMGSILAWWWW